MFNWWYSIRTAFTMVLMMGFCNAYFKWYFWQDVERYATRDPLIRHEQEFVFNNFKMLTSQQVLYFQALDQSNWFGEPQHEVVWNIVRNVVQDIESKIMALILSLIFVFYYETALNWEKNNNLWFIEIGSTAILVFVRKH